MTLFLFLKKVSSEVTIMSRCMCTFSLLICDVCFLQQFVLNPALMVASALESTGVLAHMDTRVETVKPVS